MDKILTIKEASEYLKVSKSFVYSLIAKGELPAIKLARKTKVSEIALDRYVKEHTYGI